MKIMTCFFTRSCLREFIKETPQFSYSVPGLAWSHSWLAVTERQKTQPSTYVVREKVSKFPRCWSAKKLSNNALVRAQPQSRA